MKDRLDPQDGGLPPELSALDAELSSIGYEERPSFSPELRAELARAWAKAPVREGGSTGRQLMAAGMAGLLMVAVGVPTARASLIGWAGSLLAEPAEVDDVPPPPRAFVPFASEPARTTVPADPFFASLTEPVWTESVSVPPRYDGPELTFPEIEDREAAEAIILENYPVPLQRAGIGGMVGLRLWVDASGSVDFANVGRASGVEELDRIAVRVAQTFRFTPARRRGVPVGTSVEFDVVFQAPPEQPEAEAASSARFEPVTAPARPARLDVAVTPDWSSSVTLPAPGRREAGEMLLAAMGGEAAVDGFGPIEGVLAGDPPSGVSPTAWRANVSAALESAMVRDPDNPAPLLALGRIRQSQGLRTEARVLFERGLQRALRGGDGVAPSILAELHFERGSLVRESWLGADRLGRVPSAALPRGVCAQAHSSGGAASGYASVERLIAWNYLCPEELRSVLAAAFEPAGTDNRRDLTVMSGSFRAAIEAYPGHVGANVQVLLALADEGRWQDVFEGARRFMWASRGHPYGLLISGLALHRLGRSSEAEGQFRMAMGGLSPREREAFTDIRPLLTADESEEYLSAGTSRPRWSAAYFARMDPLRSTTVNEREVEHLARSAYALLRYAGADTDAGRIWVRYGRPDNRRVFGEGGNLRTEFWDYGRGPNLTLQRPSSSLRLGLTSEARVYAGDLMSVLPHRPEGSVRSVLPLDARITAFRGTDPGSVDVRVQAQVPSALATGAGDSILVGVFLLDATDEVLAETQGRIAAREVPLILDHLAPAGAASVRVELVNETTGQAAVVRADLSLPTVSGQGGLSGLLLGRSIMPTDPPETRSPWWFEPLALDGQVDEPFVGVLFEVYGVDEGQSVRLRADLLGPDGTISDVPVRGPGDAGFSPTWNGRAGVSGRDVTYLSVSLADVAPGAYSLRISLVAENGRVEGMSEAPLERR